MADTKKGVIQEEQIDARIRELSKTIEADYAGKYVVPLTTLKGECFFSCENAKRLTIPVFMEYIQAASYEGKSSTGTLTMKLDIPADAITGKHVIIIEDVIDTGRTLSAVKELIRSRSPASLAVCSLLDKHECRVGPFDGV